jgi:CBS domain-containing protein
MKISTILATKSPNIVTSNPQQSVREAVKLLARYNIGALVVVNEQKQPIGIISERDIVRRAAQDEQVFDRQVGDIMTKNLVVGTPQDDLMAVAHTMTEGRFRHLPVVEADTNRLLGIISIGDVMKAQRDAYEGELYTLQTQILSETGDQ